MSDSSQSVILVENLTVAYGRGAAQTAAVNGLSFEVRPGETVGFIGPNGAGKSSTIKTLMGFIFAQGGRAEVFGAPAGSVEARRRIGYLPEVSLYYPFMKAREVLELYGGLAGLGRATLKRRIPELLERVGLGGKGEVLLKNFSKGMQQRVGIAQAIIADPDLLIFDEMSSGLDPVGRYELREVLLDLKRRGKTIFFSSHELYEVEALCDRVIMINKGKKIADQPVPELLARLAREGNGHGKGEVRSAERGETDLGTRGQPVTLEEHFMRLIRPEQGKRGVRSAERGEKDLETRGHGDLETVELGERKNG